mgnify:CR=1 FL=1
MDKLKVLEYEINTKIIMENIVDDKKLYLGQ